MATHNFQDLAEHCRTRMIAGSSLASRRNSSSLLQIHHELDPRLNGWKDLALQAASAVTATSQDGLRYRYTGLADIVGLQTFDVAFRSAGSVGTRSLMSSSHDPPGRVTYCSGSS